MDSNFKPMNKIPTQVENPKGLHQRYFIQKIIGWQAAVPEAQVGFYSKRKTKWVDITHEDYDSLLPNTEIRPVIVDVVS